MRRVSLALAVWLSGCYRYEPPPSVEPREATVVYAPLDRTWDVVIDLFTLRNIPIRTIERASGLIATEALRVDSAEGAAWADCGRLGDVRFTPTTAIYNVLVRGDSSESSVRTTVRWNHLSDEHDYDCASSFVWERELERDVKVRAEAGERLVTDAGQASGPAPASSSNPPAPAPVTPTRPGVRPTSPRAGRIRPNDLLLESSEFRQAADDARRLNIVVTFREFAPETLTVELGDGAFTSASAEHNLGRLFLAYRATTERRGDGALQLHHDGRRVGLYTGAGIRWERVR